jgi:hypothetical protein
MNDEGRTDQFKELNLEEYSVKKEWERKNAYFDNENEDERITREVEESLDEESIEFIERLKEEDAAEEELLVERGTDSPDLSTDPGEGGGGSGEDTEHAHRRKRKSGDQSDA